MISILDTSLTALPTYDFDTEIEVHDLKYSALPYKRNPTANISNMDDTGNEVQENSRYSNGDLHFESLNFDVVDNLTTALYNEDDLKLEKSLKSKQIEKSTEIIDDVKNSNSIESSPPPIHTKTLNLFESYQEITVTDVPDFNSNANRAISVSSSDSGIQSNKCTISYQEGLKVETEKQLISDEPNTKVTDTTRNKLSLTTSYVHIDDIPENKSHNLTDVEIITLNKTPEQSYNDQSEAAPLSDESANFSMHKTSNHDDAKDIFISTRNESETKDNTPRSRDMMMDNVIQNNEDETQETIVQMPKTPIADFRKFTVTSTPLPVNG